MTLEQVYQQWRPLALCRARRVLERAGLGMQDAEDVVQGAVVRLLQRSPDCELGLFLCAVKREALNWVRDQRSVPTADLDDHGQVEPGWGATLSADGLEEVERMEASEPRQCEWCGTSLEHLKQAGRARFCCTAHRQAANHAWRRAA